MSTSTDARSLIAFLRSLRAVRQFRPDPVPDEAVRDIVDVIRWSGSASNQQPWEVVLVRNRETLRALGALGVRPKRQTDLRRPCTPSRGPTSAVLSHALEGAPSGPRRRTTIWRTWPPNLSPAFPARPLEGYAHHLAGAALCVVLV